jgi:hypothetical protein
MKVRSTTTGVFGPIEIFFYYALVRCNVFSFFVSAPALLLLRFFGKLNFSVLLAVIEFTFVLMSPLPNLH